MEQSRQGVRVMLSEGELEAVKLAAGAFLERYVLSGDDNDRQIADTLRGILSQRDAPKIHG